MDNYQDNMQQNYQSNDGNLMSVKDWLITLIIMAIPLVGFIMLFVWAFGSEQNQSKKNFAKASLIMCVIVLVLYLILGAMFASMFLAALGGANTGN